MGLLLTVGLLGDADRNSTWEQYLRPHPSVAKVVLTKNLKAVGKVDACIILNDKDALQQAYTLLRQGIHCFIVGKLPTDLPMLIRLQQTVEEGGSILQFANWSYFNPVSLWMLEQVPKPRIMHFSREVNSKHSDAGTKLDLLWLDDMALAIRWVNSGVYKIETQSVGSPTQTISRNTYIQFDNGTTASLFHTRHATENRHIRYVSDERMILESNVIEKNVTSTFYHEKDLIIDNKSFTQELPASQAINRFLKSILMHSKSDYGIYDLVRLVRTIAKSNASISK